MLITNLSWSWQSGILDWQERPLQRKWRRHKLSKSSSRTGYFFTKFQTRRSLITVSSFSANCLHLYASTLELLSWQQRLFIRRETAECKNITKRLSCDYYCVLQTVKRTGTSCAESILLVRLLALYLHCRDTLHSSSSAKLAKTNHNWQSSSVKP